MNGSRVWLLPPLVGLLPAVGCDRPPTGPAPGGAATVRAVTVADWTSTGYSSSAGRIALNEIAATGANTAVFILTVYQDTPTSSSFHENPDRSLSPHAFAHAVDHARSVGLESVLKIHVDVDDGTWRGRIVPDDFDGWFEQYTDLVLRWASTAEALELTQLVIGTELAGIIEREPEWRSLVRQVREIFSGEVLYSASWDEVTRVPIWDELDAVGVNFYFPVADRRDPSRLEIVAAWQRWLDTLESVCERTGHQLVLTEIGYMSVDGAGMDPANFELEGHPDPAEQADLYWGALTAIANEEWIRGLYWWNWAIRDNGGPTDGGYTPRGKPAATILTEAWSRS